MVSYARKDTGVKVAVSAFVVTEPVTAPPSLCSLKVSGVRVEPFISKEKVAETAVFVPTPVAPLAGLVEVTVRVSLVGVGSPTGAEVVVNDASLPVDVPAPLFAAMR